MKRWAEVSADEVACRHSAVVAAQGQTRYSCFLERTGKTIRHGEKEVTPLPTHRLTRLTNSPRHNESSMRWAFGLL